jgi:hypothetical protein
MMRNGGCRGDRRVRGLRGKEHEKGARKGAFFVVFYGGIERLFLSIQSQKVII